jgi:hypothetical protein
MRGENRMVEAEGFCVMAGKPLKVKFRAVAKFNFFSQGRNMSNDSFVTSVYSA